jgi:hypothetical protein
MKKIALFCLIMSSSFMAKAYSIPNSQVSVRDLAALFSSESISRSLGAYAIVDVKLVAPAAYRIKTAEGCFVDVTMRDAAPVVPGSIGNGNYSPIVDTISGQHCVKSKKQPLTL